jgi:hypothetical protein
VFDVWRGGDLGRWVVHLSGARRAARR